MKTMILVALAVLSLGVGNAYAQGKPLSSHTGVYGSQDETSARRSASRPIVWRSGNFCGPTFHASAR